MRENSLMALALIGVIIGASGLGFGAYSTMQVQTGALKGDDGDDGDDGNKGDEGPPGPIDVTVAIIDPDPGDIISGNITIRAIVVGSESYTVLILLNGTEIGNSLPLMWNSTTVADGWWNITIVVIEATGIYTDQTIVYVLNTPQITPRARAYQNLGYTTELNTWDRINFNRKVYDLGNDFSLSTDRFTAPIDGYYIISAVVSLNDTQPGEFLGMAIYTSSGGHVAEQIFPRSTSTPWLSGAINDIVALNTNDYVEIRMFVSHPLFDTRSVMGGEGYTHVSISYLG